MNKFITAIAAIFISTSISAKDVNWNYFEVSSQKVKVDDFADFDGIGFTGSTLINDSMILSLGRRKVDADLILSGFTVNMELEQTTFSIGGRTGISESTDFFFTLQYHKIDVKASVSQSLFNYSQSDSDSGSGAQMGVRSMVSDSLELIAYLNYVDVVESATSYVYGGHYYFSDSFSLGINYEQDSGEKATLLTARIYF